MPDHLARITSDPDIFGGRAIIRGMRVRVVAVLQLLSAGRSHADILEELPYLEEEDIRAALASAAKKLDHPALSA